MPQQICSRDQPHNCSPPEVGYLRLVDPGVAHAMLRRRSERFKSRTVESRWVTFVSTEPILRIYPVQPNHLSVTGYLGENRSCRNNRNVLITTNHRLSRVWNVRIKFTINIDIVDSFAQPQYRPSHRQQSCIVNVQSVNFSRRRSADGPVHCSPPDPQRQSRPTRCRKPLRIAYSWNSLAVDKGYRSSHNRASKRPSPRFVDSNDTSNQGRFQAA